LSLDFPPFSSFINRLAHKLGWFLTCLFSFIISSEWGLLLLDCRNVLCAYSYT
jgi:hypothetical protein